MRFTNCTTRKPLFHHPYESNESYGKEDAIIRIVSVRVYWTTLIACEKQLEKPVRISKKKKQFSN